MERRGPAGQGGGLDTRASNALSAPNVTLNLLSSHIHDRRVFLGDTPCVYWNPQRERWECSHFDPEMWAMTGAILGKPVMVHQEAQHVIVEGTLQR